MKVTSYAVSRPAYYDRTAVGGKQFYNVDLAPHTYTTRWTITCPTGKKTFLEAGFTRLMTNTLPTTAGTAASYIQVSTGATIAFYSETGVYMSLTQYQYINDKPTLGCTLYPGDGVNADTYNFATGSSMKHTMALIYTTFDA
jgi:hypothetical protein